MGHSIHLRYQALTLLFAGSVAGTSTAFAQTADAGAPPPAAAVQDIIVTAQRRSESISRAPLAITAVTSEAMARKGITNAASLQDSIPSLHVTTLGSGTNIAIRGIVTVNPNPQGDPAVAMSIDDVYVARPNAANTDFLDIQRVEVLRGPQGTVYGRNATGGAINVISNEPVFKQEGQFSAELGNYNASLLQAVLNTPVSDSAALRGAVSWDKHDGYIASRWNDKNDASAKLRGLARLAPNLTLLLSSFYDHHGGHGSADVLYPYINPADPRAAAPYPQDFGHRNADYYGGSAKLSLDLDTFTVTYIGAYTVYHELSNIAQLGSISSAYYNARQMTHDLRFGSTSSAKTRGQFSWLAGLYAFTENQNYRNNIGQPLVPGTYSPLLLRSVTDEPHIDAQSYAAYAQGTYAATDKLRLTGGLRYTHDHKSQQGQQALTIGPNTIVLPASGARNFNNVSFRAAAEFDVTTGVMTYASITSGYHAGALTEGVAPYNSYNSETLMSYEGGLRSRFAKDRLHLNLTGYYYDYSNYQSQQIRPPFFPTPFNAKKVHVYGAEAEAVIAPTSHDQLSFGVAYEDAKFIDFSVPAAVFTGDASAYSAATGSYVYNGYDLPLVSHWSGSAAWRHTVDLKDGGHIRADISTSWRTHFQTSVNRSPLTHADGWTASDASLTFQPAHSGFEFTLFVRNLENALRITQSTIIAASTYRNFQAPRTYGARVNLRF